MPAGANLAHGHGPIGALVSAWPALALAGSFELLMTMVRTKQESYAPLVQAVLMSHHPVSATASAPPDGPSLEQTVRAWYDAGDSQRAIARELNLDRRKVKRIIDQAA